MLPERVAGRDTGLPSDLLGRVSKSRMSGGIEHSGQCKLSKKFVEAVDSCRPHTHDREAAPGERKPKMSRLLLGALLGLIFHFDGPPAIG